MIRELSLPGTEHRVFAQQIGHEVGFTWEVYAPTGLTLKRKREIVNASRAASARLSPSSALAIA